MSVTATATDQGSNTSVVGSGGILSGGITNEKIDPNWKDDFTTEFVTFLERELMPNFGMRTGFVWRGDSYKQVTLNPNRPFSAYSVPVTVAGPARRASSSLILVGSPNSRNLWAISSTRGSGRGDGSELMHHSISQLYRITTE